MFRVKLYPALESNAPEYTSADVVTIEEVTEVADQLANYTLHLHYHGLMDDYSNVLIIEEYIDGEWTDHETDCD